MVNYQECVLGGSVASGMPNSPVKLESEQSHAICQDPLGDRLG
ncbi:hypothetical protein [Laspinema palackyanum]